jgi:hypothetical protein
LLAGANDQLAADNYDAAIAAYDEVLKLEPANLPALIGRTGAISARAITKAADVRPAAGRRFRPGTTAASGPGTPVGSVPLDAEETAPAGRTGTPGTRLPGKIKFDFSPAAPRAGQRYDVRVSLTNEGGEPIGIAGVLATTTINGRRLQGPVPSLTKAVAPGQSALVFQVSESWKDETTSWSMEVVLRTTTSETYRNSLTWR